MQQREGRIEVRVSWPLSPFGDSSSDATCGGGGDYRDLPPCSFPSQQVNASHGTSCRTVCKKTTAGTLSLAAVSPAR